MTPAEVRGECWWQAASMNEVLDDDLSRADLTYLTRTLVRMHYAGVREGLKHALTVSGNAGRCDELIDAAHADERRCLNLCERATP